MPTHPQSELSHDHGHDHGRVHGPGEVTADNARRVLLALLLTGLEAAASAWDRY